MLKPADHIEIRAKILEYLEHFKEPAKVVEIAQQFGFDEPSVRQVAQAMICSGKLKYNPQLNIERREGYA